MKRLTYFFAFLIISSICSAQNIPGNSIHFSGNGNLELNLDVNEGSSATIEFWIKSQLDESQTVFSRGIRNGPPSNGNRTGLGIGNYNTNTLYNELITNGYQITNEGFWAVGYTTPNREELFDNNWHHITLVYLGGDIPPKIYLDGNFKEVTIGDPGPPPYNYNFPNADYVSIGCQFLNGEGDNYTYANIDEFRIWNHARTQEQIQSTLSDTLSSEYYSSPDSGMIAYYRFDEFEDLGVGEDGADDIRDLTYNNYHADLVGDAYLIDPNAPVPPNLYDILPGNTQLTLKWTHSNLDYMDYFKIYRSTSPNEEVLIDSVDAPALEYTDEGLINGTTYYYKLTVVDVLGEESPFSNERSGTPGNLPPVAANLNDVSIPDVGSQLTTELTFTSAGSYDPDGTIDSVFWYVNDELVGTETELSFGFYQGSNTLKLIVQDNQGATGESTAEVEITAFQTLLGGALKAGLSLIGDDLIYAVASGDAVYRMDTEGGIDYYLTVNGEVLSSSSIANDSTVYIGSTDKNLYAFTKFGVTAWPPLALGGELTATPTIDSDLDRLYLGVANSNFLALNRNTGNPVWNYFADSPIANSAVISSDRTLVFSSTSGTVYGFDIDNLSNPIEPDWTSELDDIITTSPALDNEDYLYYGTENGKLLKISIQEGNEGSVVWASELGGSIYASPVIDTEGNIYIGSTNNKFYSVNKVNGSVNWTFTTGGDIKTTAAISPENVIYFGNQIGEIFAVDISGGELWSYSDNTPIGNSLLYNDGTLFIGNYNGLVTAIYDGGGNNNNPSELPMWSTFQGNNQRTGYQNDNSLDVEQEENKIPDKFSLSQNYPNPFNPSTQIKYHLPEAGKVVIKVFNILGSEVAELVNEQKPAGRYEVTFNAGKLASGVYIYRIQAGNFVDSKKLILMK